MMAWLIRVKLFNYQRDHRNTVEQLWGAN
jgi:hypothetical protein